MQSKGAIKLLAILLAIACIYQLSFTFKSRNVEKKAAAYAAAYDGEERSEREQYYLDSVQNQPVYNLGFRKFTYKEVKEKELNLGLDLKGGMNVMLEIQVEDVVKSLAGDSKNDPAFIEAMAKASEGLKSGKDFIGEFVRSYQATTNGAPLAAIFVSPDRKDITPNSTDAEVEKILRKETDDAIDASFNILRSRIDHFGVTQPNIQRLPNSNRILVELPGVKEPERVRKLLQGSASLEFWTTYNADEILPTLMRADAVVKQYLADTTPETAEEEALPVEEADTTAGNDLIAEVASSAAGTDQNMAETSYYDREQNPLFAPEYRYLHPVLSRKRACGYKPVFRKVFQPHYIAAVKFRIHLFYICGAARYILFEKGHGNAHSAVKGRHYRRKGGGIVKPRYRAHLL